MRTLTALLMTGVIGTLGLAACGDSGGSGSSGSSGNGGSGSDAPPVELSGPVEDHGREDLASSGASPKLELEADDSYFSPTYVKVLSNAAVSITVKNEGRLQHNLSVEGQPVDVDVAPGATTVVQVRAPSGGSVRFFCSIHESSGMQGAIYATVSAGGPATGGGSSGSGGGSSGGTPGY